MLPLIHNTPTANFEIRQGRIIERFKLSLISNIASIILLRELFQKRPPGPGQDMPIEYTDGAGKKVSLGSLPATKETIEKLEEQKGELIRQATSELVECFEMFIEEEFSFFLERFQTCPNSELSKCFKTTNPREPKQVLKAFEMLFQESPENDSDFCSQFRPFIQLPTELRHLWTHRGKHLDNEFFKKIDRHISPTQLTYLGRPRPVKEGESFPLEMRDVQELADQFLDFAKTLATKVEGLL